MSIFTILLVSLFTQGDTPNIYEMPISEVYLKADEMKSFDFGFTEYSKSQKSGGFDFITLKPVNQTSEGYFQSYFSDGGIRKVVKFSSEEKKEYVVFVDSRNEGYSFLWLFFYEKQKLMSNGFFLNIAEQELYFMGLSEPMGSLLEIVDSAGQVERFDFGQIYTLPEGEISSVVGQIASIDKSLLPLSILHYQAGKPFGIEYLEDDALHVFSFTEKDCEEEKLALSDLDFSSMSSLLAGDICFDSKVFDLKIRYTDLQDYYTQRTF